MTRRLTTWCVFLALAMSCEAGSLAPGGDVATRTWKTEKDRPFAYPERELEGFARGDDRKGRTFGITVSGGGSRSAGATLGQLWALEKLGWLDEAEYLSAVSGGAWTAVPYTFLPRHHDGSFFGEIVAPDQLTDSKLKNVEAWSHQRALSRSFLVLTFFGNVLTGAFDESWSRTVGRRFLHPYGLNDLERPFAHWADVPRESRLPVESFYLSRSDRPFLVVGGTVLAGKGGRGDGEKTRFPYEWTPLYSGVRTPGVSPVRGPMRTRRLGGYVESFAADSYAPTAATRDAGERELVEIGGDRHLTTLSDVIGASSAAVQQSLQRVRLYNLGFPEFRVWPVTTDTEEARTEPVHPKRELAFGDGGHVDNIGLLPLLARQVDDILVFVNTAQEFDLLDYVESGVLREAVLTICSPDDVPLFDVEAEDEPTAEEAADRELAREGLLRAIDEWSTDSTAGESLYSDLIAYFRPVYGKKGRSKRLNVVFKDGNERLLDLVEGLMKRKLCGRPLVHCQQYEVRPSTRHGIRAIDEDGEAYKPEICWVYLDRTERWMSEMKKSGLSAKTKHRLEAEKRPFKNFPHYKTFFQNPGLVVKLGKRQVNALANLTAWTVCEEQAHIGDVLGLRFGVASDCYDGP
ncbi:MAG: hypothetical protein AAF533_05475 [Acidobacteriota bacterium]